MEPCSTGSAPLPSRELALAALFLTFCAFEENLLELLGKRGVIEQARSCWCPEAGRSFEAYRLRLLRRSRGGQSGLALSGILIVR